MKIKPGARMNPKVLDGIKQTEKKADSLSRAAERQAEKIVQTAKQTALKRLSAEQQKIDTKTDSQLQEEETKLITEKKRILQKGKREVKTVQELAEKNMAKAVQYVLKEFESEL